MLSLLPLSLRGGDDERSLGLCRGPNGRLSSRSAYGLLRFGGIYTPVEPFLWGSTAPSRVKFFGWLLSLSRIHTRDVLLRKTIITVVEVGCPCCAAPLETVDHLFFQCGFAASLWRRLRIDVSSATVADLYCVDVSSAVGEASPAAFLLLCIWHLWKWCNAVVFCDKVLSLTTMLKLCRDDAVLWRGRFRADRIGDIDVS